MISLDSRAHGGPVRVPMPGVTEPASPLTRGRAGA
jgi:hypothetical protein